MDCEHKLKIVEQELASLREENRLLKEKLSLWSMALITLVSKKNMQ